MIWYLIIVEDYFKKLWNSDKINIIESNQRREFNYKLERRDPRLIEIQLEH